MGFYIRKSVRVGLFRFNLSNSGIGVSTGIPGLRIGSGPRGTYVHIGRGGLYYRQTLTHSRSRPRPIPKSPSAGSQSSDWTLGPMHSVGSGDVTEMADSNFAELLDEIETRRRRRSLWPLMLVMTFLFAAFLLIDDVQVWAQITCLCFLFVGILIVAQIDRIRKFVVLMYDLDDEDLDNYKTLHSALDEMTSCGGVWHITAQGNVYDSKYHAGAGSIVRRRAFKLMYRNPPWICTNLLLPCLSFHELTLYLLPDLILAQSPDGFGAIDYASLIFDSHISRFIEGNSVPHDAVVLGHTWQFVNKDGGPDRRFNNNRQIPVCEYEELRISHSSGLHQRLQFSRCGISECLQAAVTEVAAGIRRAIAQAEIQHHKRHVDVRLSEPQPVSGAESKRRNDQSSLPENLDSALFELLCCMMAADGRISTTEIAKLNQVMSKVQPTWTENHGRSKINTFINEMKKRGYALLLDQAISKLPMFKQQNREHTLLKCMEAVANADGKRSERETKLLDRIRSALSD